MKNPWLGLSSYTEESLKHYQFNGRDAAIASLVALIRRNLFVTLYGRSGIGKTSLLQAGVFPMLRREGFIPLSIRLNDLDDDAKASEVIWGNVCETLQIEGYKYSYCDPSDEYNPDFSDILVLRKLFSAGKFINPEGIEAIPIIAIDQFEEVLYKNPDASRLLILQLYALIDDNYNLRITHRNWHDDTNFRIIISIREDDLFLFEDYIDSLNCIDFKSNRYRLLPLSEKEAKEVVLNPAANNGIFSPGDEDTIADAIVELSKNGGQNVNTLLLSLICHVLYEDSATQSKPISLSGLDRYKDVLESYYTEITKKIPKEQRYWIEDHLIDEQGRRTSVYTSDLIKFAPQAKQLIGNTNHRLLNDNQGRVEFIHDQLAASVMKIRRARKSKKTKRYGVIVLIMMLLGLFFFSFSVYPDISELKVYKDANNLICDVETTEISIHLDSLNPFYRIDDCPSLKSISIEGTDGTVEIYNCPSLVNIYKKDFFGDIYVYNCPNIDKYDKKIKQHVVYDSISYEEYRSQYPTIYSQSDNNSTYFLYDSLANSLIVNRTPRCVTSMGRYKVVTGLPDSIKRITDCYVVFGQKDYYSQLLEYQAFKSIRELPVYYTWQSHLKAMFAFLDANELWLNLSIIGILLVQYLFWIIAFSDFKTKYNNRISLFFIVFIYGIGMSILAIISFMACYWTIFNIVCPFNQTISWIVGVIGCICCMTIVYKNSFYSLYSYLKSNGIRGLILDIKDSIKNTPSQARLTYSKIRKSITIILQFLQKKYKLIVFLILLVAICLSFYFNEKNKRENYITEINNIIENGEYARAYAIIEELEKQKTSVLFPSFAKDLSSVKNSLSGHSRFLIRNIFPALVEDWANKDMGFFYFPKLLAVSDDATKLSICVECRKSNDLQEDSCQAILLDITNQTVCALTPKTTKWPSDFECAISPSNKTIVTTVGYKRYKYLSDKMQSDEIEDNFPHYRDVEDVILRNDSVYYFTSWGTLYEAFIDNHEDPAVINSTEEMWDNMYMISDNVIGTTGNWGEVIIYNILADSVYIHSKQRYTSSGLRSINNDYAITGSGLFDLKRDTFINKNDSYYEFKGGVVELQKKEPGLYSFVDLNGEEIITIETEHGDDFNDIRFSGDGNSIISYRDNSIYIYCIASPILSDTDKKLFDLK